MGIMKAIDIEIKNSKVLHYIQHEINTLLEEVVVLQAKNEAILEALDSALLQRAKDWEQLQSLILQVDGHNNSIKEILIILGLDV